MVGSSNATCWSRWWRLRCGSSVRPGSSMLPIRWLAPSLVTQAAENPGAVCALQGRRRPVVGHHTEHLGVPADHRLEVRGRESDVV